MLKALIEKRNKAVERMKEIAANAVTETRALTADETKEYDDLKTEVEGLDASIKRAKDSATMQLDGEPEDGNTAGTDGETREMRDDMDMAEVRAFADYIRTAKVETRDDANMTMTDNGAIIPKTIAAKIIKQVKDISPIYAAATKYNVKGTLSIPYYDETTDHVTVAWATEFTELESHTGKFKTIDLTGFLAGALTKISRSLLNSQDFDLVSFVVNDMAEKVAEFIESEIIKGTKVGGLSGVTNVTTAAAVDAVTADELIDLKDSIKDRFQSGCMWVMSRKTRTAIRKLKDSDGQYLLNRDITAPFGYTLLGMPIYVSDNMPEMATSAKAIYYGDFSGLAVKMVEEPNVQILQEHYATQHAIGAVCWLEFDSKVEDAQKLAVLQMGAGA